MKYLIAGLGNIGKEYEGTRHNIGFSVLDHFAGKEGFTFKADRYAHFAEFRLKGRILNFVKPSTYMNLSGKAIQYWIQKTGVEFADCLVIADDIALPFGAQRLRTKGGDGGHNGLCNVIEVTQRVDFPRLRFGIGNDFPKGYQVEYVLGRWFPEQEKELPAFLDRSNEIIKSFVLAGVARTMTQYNQ
ncbi:MAG: aminoacyl-tRNA hydrolase [Bacteroidetes bacterium]|nr:aminoacyl-tRNA hydrolase [Bacteroidota bacterium]MBU1718484.1 aminoacyl-tRNA hydrolase [Bacteroidota bacterium]